MRALIKQTINKIAFYVVILEFNFYDKKGSTTGRDYVFMETFGKTYDEFMSSRGEQNMEPVEKEMKKTEKVEVTSVNVTDEQCYASIRLPLSHCISYFLSRWFGCG
jgi:hypothetical protein